MSLSPPPATPRSRVHNDDPHRPIYHFLPLNNWMNDPNGLIKWNDQYHLFYQYNPNGPFHGTIHWGHAVSDDLVHWSFLPVALTPTPGSPDAGGCWSGCAVDDNGTPTIIYTGLGQDGHTQRPCLATSHDDLRTLDKHPGNPIIAAPPPELDLLGFRDHWLWREDGMWYQIIGSGIRNVGGAVLLYRSHDLRAWEYLHPLLVGSYAREPLYAGQVWECPQFLFFGDQAVLAVSAWDKERLLYSVYFIGTYRDKRFTPHTQRKLDYGDLHFYAPQTLVEPGGRKLMWGWIQEGRPEQVCIDAGWSGVMSLPRVVDLRPDGLLALTPAPELAALRGDHAHFADIALAVGDTPLDVQGDALELVAEATLDAQATFGLALRCSPDGQEQTVVGYDGAAQQLFVDRRQSSRDQHVARDVQAGPLTLAAGEPLRLRILLDRSVIEVFANERACLTSRVYPTRSDSIGVRLHARGGQVHIRALDAWQMHSINLFGPAT